MGLFDKFKKKKEPLPDLPPPDNSSGLEMQNQDLGASFPNPDMNPIAQENSNPFGDAPDFSSSLPDLPDVDQEGEQNLDNNQNFQGISDPKEVPENTADFDPPIFSELDEDHPTTEDSLGSLDFNFPEDDAVEAPQEVDLEPEPPEFEEHVQKGPLFVRIDDFREVLRVLDVAKTELEECLEIGSGIQNTTTSDLKATERLQTEITQLNKKLYVIDEKLFER